MGQAPGELLAAGMGDQDRDGATRDAGSDTVGTTRQDNRHPRAQYETGAVRVGEEAELLGEYVAGLEIGHEENVGISRYVRANAFDVGGLPADRIVECQWAVEDGEFDLAAVGHFAKRRGVDGGGHLRVHGLDGGKNGDFGSSDAKRNGEVDGVLADVEFIFQRGRDVDGRVGNNEHLVIGRNV